jgi:hypothetical protein
VIIDKGIKLRKWGIGWFPLVEKTLISRRIVHLILPLLIFPLFLRPAFAEATVGEPANLTEATGLPLT